jgi:hypothetical protein
MRLAAPSRYQSQCRLWRQLRQKFEQFARVAHRPMPRTNGLLAAPDAQHTRPYAKRVQRAANCRVYSTVVAGCSLRRDKSARPSSPRSLPHAATRHQRLSDANARPQWPTTSESTLTREQTQQCRAQFRCMPHALYGCTALPQLNCGGPLEAVSAPTETTACHRGELRAMRRWCTDPQIAEQQRPCKRSSGSLPGCSWLRSASAG